MNLNTQKPLRELCRAYVWYSTRGCKKQADKCLERIRWWLDIMAGVPA